MVTVALLLLLTVISLTAASELGREKAIMMFGCPHHGLTSKKAEHFLFFSQDKFKQTETSQKTGCFAAPKNKKTVRKLSRLANSPSSVMASVGKELNGEVSN